MKERGILMTPANYGKCADGSKTQTRRIVKPQPSDDIDNSGDCESIIDMKTGKTMKCPYGVPGDRLYVKEGWCPRSNGALLIERMQKPFYRIKDGENDMAKPKDWKWRSPMFMPKWAARLWLEIVDVRVERLHDINEADAIAEGCTSDIGNTDPKATYLSTAVAEYRHLWDSINGYEAWRKNDWVWVLTFTKVPA